MLQISSFDRQLNTEEDKSSFYTDYNNNEYLRKVLQDTIESKIDSSIKEAESKDKYTSTNWEYYQSDNLGYRRALREVVNLINVKILKEETK